jgi:hypothetical protein
MADVTKVVLKQNNEVIKEYEFSVFELIDDDLIVHLKEPKIYDKPKKEFYKIELWKNDQIELEKNCIFRQYQVLMDNGVYQGQEESELKYIQNFLKFEILD